MRFFRQIIRDAASGGVLAGLIAVMMLLQAAIGGYAQASMVSVEGAFEVICSGEGHSGHTDKRPYSNHDRTCCQAACQIVASITPGLASGDPEPFAVVRPVGKAIGAKSQPHYETPRLLGLSGDVRGPPSFS